jgi:hypothetical protein
MFIFFVTSTASRNACHHKPDERPPSINLLGGNVNLASLDVVGDVLGAAAVNTATNRESGTEDLKDGTLELLSQRTVAHGAGDLDDVIERDRLGVLDVLLLLAVTRGLLEGLDDQRGSGGHNGDGGLTVLDGETDGHTETLPVTSVLGDIFTDLLGGQTERTDLGSQSGLGSDLTTSHTQVNDLHLIGVELGSDPEVTGQSPAIIKPRR